METVLDRITRASKLVRNDNGLYSLAITDGPELVLKVDNVTFQRAVVLLEDYMHTKRRTEK